jgi:hypothetical protein
MNQDVLPPDPKPVLDFRMRDRLNGWTGLLSCRFLEWSSWYNQSIRNRLIGHHRLFKHFKKNYEKYPRDFPAAQAYILQYRSNYAVKNFICRATSLLYSIFTFRGFAPAGEYAVINRCLIYERTDILREFLTAAETHFDSALDQATRQILAPAFLDNPAALPNNPIAIQYNDNQTNVQYHDNRTNNQFNDNRISNSQVIHQHILHEGAKGKEKGVFSKKQLLILFDLLAETSAVERIDYGKPTKFSDIAALFQAITGKPATSFIEELNDYRNEGLYQFHTRGERDQLIVALTNLANTCRTAGFRSIAKQAEKKIRLLEPAKYK